MALIIVTPTTPTTGTSTTTGASTAAARTSAATTARRAATIGLGTGFVNVQRAPAQLFAIQRGDSFLRFCGVGHFDERKSA